MGRVVEIFRKNTLERDECWPRGHRLPTGSSSRSGADGGTGAISRELRALGEVTQAVNSTIDLETVLTTIVAKATQLSGTEAGAIYVFDEASQEFRVSATYGMDETFDRGRQGPSHPHGRALC